MAKKVRQFCDACNQVTTQVRQADSNKWTCLCCESAKFRCEVTTEEIQKRNKKRDRLNLTF